MKIPELNKNQLVFLAVCTVVIAIVVAVVYFYGRKIKAWFVGRKVERSYDVEIHETELTISAQQAHAIASKMYYAMKGPGTNEDNLYSAFRQIENYSDLMLVMKSFGTMAGEGETLPEWIADDCSSKEIAIINGILASKNINFAF